MADHKARQKAVPPDVPPSPLDVSPGCLPPANAAPEPTTAIPCLNCERLAAEVTRLDAEIIRLAADYDRATLAKDQEIIRLMEKISNLEAQGRTTGSSKPQADDADALRQRVIADNVERINSYSRGHVIGTART